MAEVFAAHSDQLGQVALKRILPGLAEDQEFADMFWDEARITSRLEHPNIVRLLDYGRINQQLYMALEYVEGPTLARVLRKAARTGQAFDIPVLVGLMVELLDALHYVHTAVDERGKPLSIVHRDVSPGNVMMTAHGHVKLGDFGIVRSQAVIRRTQPGELKGKIGYMAPEQALGEPVSLRSDVFSVGIIMAEFLTLRPLFLGKNEMQTLSRTVNVDLSTWHRFNQHVPVPLRGVVERALRKDANERYASAAHMRAALLEVARSAGWGLDNRRVVSFLQELELLSREDARSGERRVQLPRHLDGAGADQQNSFSTSQELPTIVQELGAPRRPQGRPVWQMEFTPTTLPMQLFSALRRAYDGVIELSSGSELLSLEICQGRILAAHDSTGFLPLGRMLQNSSLATPKDLALAIGESRRANQRLGEFLVGQGRLRESILARLINEQTLNRLARWFDDRRGQIAVFVDEQASPMSASEREPASVAMFVAALRLGYNQERLERALASVMKSVVLSIPGVSPTTLAFTDPEVRALRTTLEGGAYEGLPVRAVIESVEKERIARRTEAMFALFVALSAGFIHAPGFGQ
jgi:serine/threonine protein kinase